jgi:hypothetical protein
VLDPALNGDKILVRILVVVKKREWCSADFFRGARKSNLKINHNFKRATAVTLNLQWQSLCYLSCLRNLRAALRLAARGAVCFLITGANDALAILAAAERRIPLKRGTFTWRTNCVPIWQALNAAVRSMCLVIKANWIFLSLRRSYKRTGIAT